GSAFSSFTESQEYVHEVEERCSDYKRAHGEYPDTAAKDLIKHDLAVKHLTKALSPKSGLISEQEVMKFITDSYNKMRQPVAGY
ncbi:hypothetical protein DKY64_22790, partial [Stenotrophomonas maltophilia]